MPRGEMPEDYHRNFGTPHTADGARGTDEKILERCFEKERRLNTGDILVWNGFASKLG